jgi:hypothetical protein
VIGVCSTSDTIPIFVNEAQERLLNRSTDPIGAVMRFQVCVGNDNCLTLPREVLTVKSFWLCNTPGRFVSEFFEAIGWAEGGYGLRDGNNSQGACACDGATMIDRGTDCVFDQPIATSTQLRKIQVVAADTSDNGKKIIIRYVDSNGNRVYTNIDGVVQEGEQVTLSTAGTLTASYVANGGIYAVTKDVTNYPVRLYTYDVVNSIQTALLAVYAPSETLPIYRKVTIPGLTNANNTNCCGSASDDTSCTNQKSLTILARLQHVPVVVDNDCLVICNLPALKLMVKAIKLEEQQELAMAADFRAQAALELDGEIAAYFGDGMRINMRVADVSTWGAGSVFSPVGWGSWGWFN